MPYDRTSYFENRNRNLAQAAAPQMPVNSAGYAPGEGWGADHNFSVPEAMMRVAETEANSRENIARTQAGASMYGSDNTLEGTLSPKENYNYSLTRAAGGPVKGKRPYLVGEKGPELIVPKRSGTVIPNHTLREIARAVPRAEGGDIEAGGAPVEVIRGLDRTVPTGGMDSRVQQRSLNAAARFGTAANNKLVAQKSLLQATADIDPTGARAVNLATAADKEAATEKIALADEQKAYKDAFQNDHAIGYKQDAAGRPSAIMPVDDNLNRIFLKGHGYVQTGTHTADEAYQAIQPDLQKHYYTPENVDKALQAISQRTGQPITPQWRANAMSGSPEAIKALYPEIRSTLSQPKPGFWGSAGKNLATPANPFEQVGP